MGYVDEQGGLEQDDGKRKCIIKGKDEQQWECPKNIFVIVLPKSMTNNSCGDSAKSIRMLLHMWDEKR